MIIVFDTEKMRKRLQKLEIKKFNFLIENQ